MKNKIIQILKKHPNGLKARKIADLIPGMDKKEVNSILYSNPQSFVVNDYVWTLKSSISSAKCDKRITSSTDIDDYIRRVTIYFGEYNCYPYEIKRKLHKFSSKKIDDCISNLEALINTPFLKEHHRYLNRHSVEYIIKLSTLSLQDVAKKVAKVKKFDIESFDAWRAIIDLPDYKYESLLNYKKKLAEIEVPICFNFHLPTWTLLSHLLNNNDFEMVKAHSHALCSSIKLDKYTSFNGDEWYKIVILPDDTFLLSLKNIKSFIEDDEKYHFIKFHLSINDIIQYAHLSSKKFYQNVEEAYKQKLVEDLQKNKHKAYDKPPTQVSQQVLEVARKCTGNCSTCKRDNCPER